MDIVAQASERLKGRNSKVIFTECTDERILKAARILKDKKICNPILLGNPEEILAATDLLGISVDDFSVFNSGNQEWMEEYARLYHQAVPMYSEKNILKKMKNPLNYAAMLVKIGYGDCLASGVVNPTGDVVLAAQQFIGIKEGISTISSIGLQICRRFDSSGEMQVIGVSDCAINAAPDAGQLAGIAITSAESYQNITGCEARVALLSYSTMGSSDGLSVQLVQEAVRLANERRPDIIIEGEFQIDAALVPQIAARKIKVESKVAGKANVLIFPDLDAGNIAVKCMQMFGEGASYGPLLQGFSRPVTDFSRAATVQDVVGNVTLCLLQEDKYEERV